MLHTLELWIAHNNTHKLTFPRYVPTHTKEMYTHTHWNFFFPFFFISVFLF